MALQFKHFKEILEDWLSYIIGHSEITDINVGSVTRTYGEATALEVAQGYVQMNILKNLFSISRTFGDDLDERALDYGADLVRYQPTQSFGVITVGDSDLTSADTAFSTLATALVSGLSTQAQIQVADYASFPSTGSIIIARGLTGERELIVYSSKTAPDLLDLVTTPVNNHAIGATVHLSTIGTDRTIAAGTVVKTESPELKFETTEIATLYDGDYRVLNVPTQSQETGTANNISPGQIVYFETPPFPTATVTNPDRYFGGIDLESDSAFQARIKNYIRNLSSSTAYKILSKTLNVQIASTGQRVVTAKVVEPIAPGELVVYINDGTTTYVPSTVSVTQTEVLLSVAEAGQTRATIKNWPLVSGTERLFVSLERGTTSAVGSGLLTDATKTWTTNQWVGYNVKDENNVIFSITANTATTLTLLETTPDPQLGAYAIFDPSNTLYPTGSLLDAAVDYEINSTRGDIELTSTSFPTGLQAQDTLLAYYNGVTAAYVYYDGLLQEVQKVLNGDPKDFATYPGEIAGGTICIVTTPVIVTIDVYATMSAQAGIDELAIREDVRTAILNYINNLSIGDDVLRSSIIAAAKGVSGVYDFVLVTPATNVVITDSQLAKTTTANINIT